MSETPVPETPEKKLDLYDIQGNIVKGYARYDYPKARYIFYHIADLKKGRYFLLELLDLITTGEPWKQSHYTHPNAARLKPLATTNVAFTYSGLEHLGVPQKSLQSFPQEFVMGMKGRVSILGDDATSAPDHWDPIWQQPLSIDMWLSINGETLAAIEERYQTITELLNDAAIKGGIQQLKGHCGAEGQTDLPYQDASAVYENGFPTPKEHFGYTDGISDPYFKGSGRNARAVVGGGKLTGEDPTTPEGWAPLETGEFILGYRDESEEYPKAPIPRLLSFNGTFMVYRKLHENVGSFNRYLDELGQQYPDGKEALAAKFAGRWRNGAPLALFDTEQEAEAYAQELHDLTIKRHQAKAAGKRDEALDKRFYELRQQQVAYNFDQDLPGGKCPVGAHTRRINPRGALEFGQKGAYATPGALTDRRRILRRGLPYGEVSDPTKDDGNHGIIFMAINSSIERQFEFVQQQWINYGNDFKLSNDKDPLLGNHGRTPDGKGTGRMIIEGVDPTQYPDDPSMNTKKPPFVCAHMPRFVDTRGGDYFFIPSITAIRMMGEGIIDPT